MPQIRRESISKGREYLDTWNVLISKTGAEHAGESDAEGKCRLLTSAMRVIGPNEACTHSYFVLGKFAECESASNALKYLKTRFVRLLIHLAMASINISRKSLIFVPLQDLTASPDLDRVNSGN